MGRLDRDGTVLRRDDLEVSVMDDDEVTEDLRLISKLSKSSRWEITPRVRRKVMETLEAGLDCADPAVALKAVDLLMKADALNLAAEKVDGGGEEVEGKVVLLLPPNGTERK